MFYITQPGEAIRPFLEFDQKKGLTPRVSKSRATAHSHKVMSGEAPKERVPGYDEPNKQFQESERIEVQFVAQIMTKPVISIRDNQNASQAWLMFKKHPCHHFPVVNDSGQLCGIISDRDLLAISLSASEKKPLAQVELTSIMATQVITARGETRIRDAAELMSLQQISALPVLNAVGSLEGILTRSDILRSLIHQAPLSLWV